MAPLVSVSLTRNNLSLIHQESAVQLLLFYSSSGLVLSPLLSLASVHATLQLKRLFPPLFESNTSCLAKAFEVDSKLFSMVWEVFPCSNRFPRGSFSLPAACCNLAVSEISTSSFGSTLLSLDHLSRKAFPNSHIPESRKQIISIFKKIKLGV